MALSLGYTRKAIIPEKYGPPDEVLRLQEVDEPVIGDDEILVRVRAASVHPDVWHDVQWNGSGRATGISVAVLETEEVTERRKLVLLR